MRIEGKKVYLTKEEVTKAVCPINPRWAQGMVRAYGPNSFRSERLQKAALCPEVLKGADYEVIIEDEKKPTQE